ncbi:MAG: FHA domain-containing protein [Deltaproteobacteria bacterium]|nr:FHA domain-containing protein [Deltaproteobacteria bacterium]
MKDNVSIGRSPSNDLVLTAPKVSRQHAAINKYKDQYIIIDLKSSNGVYVNGRKVDEHVLMEGDQISVGGYKFVFQKI